MNPQPSPRAHVCRPIAPGIPRNRAAGRRGYDFLSGVKSQPGRGWGGSEGPSRLLIGRPALCLGLDGSSSVLGLDLVALGDDRPGLRRGDGPALDVANDVELVVAPAGCDPGEQRGGDVADGGVV